MSNQQASILVVDDQPLSLATLQAALELDGYQIHTASNGLEALEILKVTPIDLIIADIAMPKMNGYQLYEAVRIQAKWVHIPYIFLTARSMDSDIRYGKELGVDDYITKPFQLDDLRATISGKLRRWRNQIEIARESEYTQPQPEGTIVIDNLSIQPQQHRVLVGTNEVKLSIKEFSLLLHLAQNIGNVTSLEELCEVTHELKTNRVEAGSLLYPLIRSLRQKLKKGNFNAERIQTVRGVGYYLV
jgi:DNA-binding response OmpR family regulator